MTPAPAQGLGGRHQQSPGRRRVQLAAAGRTPPEDTVLHLLAYLAGVGTVLIALAVRGILDGAEDDQLEERPR